MQIDGSYSYEFCVGGDCPNRWIIEARETGLNSIFVHRTLRRRLENVNVDVLSQRSASELPLSPTQPGKWVLSFHERLTVLISSVGLMPASLVCNPSLIVTMTVDLTRIVSRFPFS